jgi:hypothetical protein
MRPRICVCRDAPCGSRTSTCRICSYLSCVVIPGGVLITNKKYNKKRSELYITEECTLQLAFWEVQRTVLLRKNTESVMS